MEKAELAAIMLELPRGTIYVVFLLNEFFECAVELIPVYLAAFVVFLATGFDCRCGFSSC